MGNGGQPERVKGIDDKTILSALQVSQDMRATTIACLAVLKPAH